MKIYRKRKIDGITAEREFEYSRPSKGLSCLLLFVFFVTQTGIAYAADAPVLDFNPQSGMPEAIVTADVIQEAADKRLIEQEEEKNEKKKSDEFFGTEDGPLSEPTEDGEVSEGGDPSAAGANTEKNESKPAASQAAAIFSAGGKGRNASKVEAQEQKTASVGASYLFPPIFVQRSEREEKHKIIEVIKDLLEDQKRDRDRQRNEKNDQPLRTKPRDREVLKAVSDPPIVVVERRYFESGNVPTVQELTPPVLSSPSDRTAENSSSPRASSSDPFLAMGDANAASEAMQNKPLMLTNPEAYVTGPATLKIMLVSLVSLAVSATDNAGLIEFVNDQYINSLEQTNENDVVSILTQIMDLEAAIEQLIEDQQDMADSVSQEAGVVRNVLKALAPHQNEISESVIKEILARSKPANIQSADYLQGKSLGVYLQNQILQWQEVKVQVQQDIATVKAAGAGQDADLDDLKNVLKETTAMLITAEMWESMARTAREKLEQYFNELLNARESLRTALERFGQMKETAFENAVDRIQASEKHMYHIWARTEELYEQINELSTLRREYSEKFTKEAEHIRETIKTLQGIRTDDLTEQEKSAVASLRERVEKILASSPSLEEAVPVTLDFESAQSALKEASNIELAAAAAFAAGTVNETELREMEQSLGTLSEQILALAGRMINEANRAKNDIQNVESALNGAEQRALLVDGYLDEIQAVIGESPLVP